MNPWVIAIAGLMLTLSGLIVVWISSGYKKARDEAKMLTSITDTQNDHQNDIQEMQKQIRAHDNLFAAVELRFSEFTQVQRSVTGLEKSFDKMKEKFDERNDKVDDELKEQTDLMHKIHIEVVKLAK